MIPDKDDFLLLIDGPTLDDPELWRGCGEKDFQPIKKRSSSRYMTVWFHSGPVQKEFHGFEATYYASCGGVFSQSEGVIMSPNYPEEYDQGIDCEWLIQLVPGHVVQLKFAQSHEYPFNIDGHGTYCNESAYADDYIALYNGPTTDNPLAPDSRNEQLSPFHCGLYDEDPDFKLPGFKSTESSGKGVRTYSLNHITRDLARFSCTVRVLGTPD